MSYHGRLLPRIVVVLTIKIKAGRKWEREPDRAIDPAALLSWICIGWGADFAGAARRRRNLCFGGLLSDIYFQ